MPKTKRADLSPISSASSSSSSSSPAPSISGATASNNNDDYELELEVMNSPASSRSSSCSYTDTTISIRPPAKKKQKINPFSIEAIMQQSSPPTRSSSSSLEQQQQQQHQTHQHHHQHHHHQQQHNSNHLSQQQHAINHHISNYHLDQQQHQPNNIHRSSTTAPAASASAGGSSSTKGVGGNKGAPATNSLSRIECTLDNKDMWDKFHSLNTEMIITKTGRRMFPVVKVQFHNLDPNARYAVAMDILPVDNKRYRYAYHKSCWQVAGKADPSAEPRLYPHPDSPFNGDLLSRQVISFEKVKLTNNEMDKSGHIILNSMHKYQPRVHLIELKPATAAPSSHQQTNGHFIDATRHLKSNNNTTTYSDRSQNNHHQHNNQQQQQQIPGFVSGDYRSFEFPETVFTAVTAYQNQLITKMKIDKNPFAKGFRDSSRLSDLDRNDPFDYMGPLGQSGRFGGTGGPGGPAGSLDGSGGPHGSPMDAFQLLAASAANNPWYSAAAMAAAASSAGAGGLAANLSGGPGAGAGGGGASNPFGLMGACGSAQAAQLQTQMMLAAFSAYINGGAAAAASAAAVAGSSNNQSPEDK